MQGRATNFANIVSLLGALVATSVVLGLLGAGLVMPAVGATGAAARQGVQVFDSLPGDFTQTPLSQQSRILASDGTLIATPYDENRVIVPLAQIAPVNQQQLVPRGSRTGRSRQSAPRLSPTPCSSGAQPSRPPSRSASAAR